MLYRPFARVNNVPVPLGLDQEIGCIMRLIAEARARRAAVLPTATATEKFPRPPRHPFPGTVWICGCKNWYTSRQPTPVLWPFPQSEHKAFFEKVPVDDFQFIPNERGALSHRSVDGAGGRAAHYRLAGERVVEGAIKNPEPVRFVGKAR